MNLESLFDFYESPCEVSLRKEYIGLVSTVLTTGDIKSSQFNLYKHCEVTQFFTTRTESGCVNELDVTVYVDDEDEYDEEEDEEDEEDEDERVACIVRRELKQLLEQLVLDLDDVITEEGDK